MDDDEKNESAHADRVVQRSERTPLSASIIFRLLSVLLLLYADLCASEPAVWGEPAPDYASAVRLHHDMPILVHALLFIDGKITAHYENDTEKAKSEVLKVVKEANTYLGQLRVAVVVVDVIDTGRADLSLYAFNDYRQKRLAELPRHDVATLLSLHYAGGLAFVDGICASNPVMLVGFYPTEPTAMGSIFFHELAHLFGVPHRSANLSFHVDNCACPAIVSNTSQGCLKIPGFDHDCTVQQLANILTTKPCLSRHAQLGSPDSAVCNNGVLEGREDCDCGLALNCNWWKNCTPLCEYRLHPAYMMMSMMGAVLILMASLLHRLGLLVPLVVHTKLSITGQSHFSWAQLVMLAEKPEKKLSSPSSSLSAPVISPPMLVHLEDHPSPAQSCRVSRPRCAPPPPPPPPSVLSAQLSPRLASTHGRRPTVPPPPRPPPLPFSQASLSKRHHIEEGGDGDSITHKFASFESDDGDPDDP